MNKEEFFIWLEGYLECARENIDYLYIQDKMKSVDTTKLPCPLVTPTTTPIPWIIQSPNLDPYKIWNDEKITFYPTGDVGLGTINVNSTAEHCDGGC